MRTVIVATLALVLGAGGAIAVSDSRHHSQQAAQYTAELQHGADPVWVQRQAQSVCEVIYYPAIHRYQCEQW